MYFVAASAFSLAATLVLSATPTEVFAGDMFGQLRAPGDAAFIAGHRGDRSLAPENTMVAFRAALAEPMIDFIETDVQLSRDGVPMLFHDVDLRRITSARSGIGDLDAKDLARLDVGSWYGPEFASERIPTLEQFLLLLKDSDKKALVELKFIWSGEEIERVVSLIDKHGLRDRVLLQAFSIETLTNLKEVAPQFPRLMLIRELPSDPVPLAERLGVIAFGTTARSVAAAPEAVEALHASGLGVVCYTLNTEDSWAEVSELGVDGIITDVPSKLDGWLAETAPGT